MQICFKLKKCFNFRTWFILLNNHVSNEDLKRNIFETLRDSLTKESSSKPFPQRKIIPEKILSKILKTPKEETPVSIDNLNFQINCLKKRNFST